MQPAAARAARSRSDRTPGKWICAAHQGCDIAQGYLIARPTLAAEMTTMLLDDLFLPGALIPVAAPA
jgi:EAL domain-containing protein (putative c-di-GMP-specific phosphodiesterase class I)